MRVLLFGATGMVGAGVLKECLDDKRVENILIVGRRTCGITHDKIREILHEDFFDFSSIKKSLTDRDACFFCLGVSSVGKDEETYSRQTYDLTMAAATAVLESTSAATFIYVSGVGADSTEKGKSMWARVRGRLENRLLTMPFKGVYVFRPSYIQPLRGVQSRVFLYRILYATIGWAYPILKRLFPGSVTTTVAIGQAMINLAESGYPEQILEVDGINSASASPNIS